MNVNCVANRSFLPPPLVPSGASGGRLTRISHVLAAVAVLAFTSTAPAQENKASAPLRAVSSEWLRMREGLKKAKPMPLPQYGDKSALHAVSSDLVSFDTSTRQITHVRAAKVENSNLLDRELGNPGELPRPVAGAPPLIGAGHPEDFGGLVGTHITPTKPNPFPIPFVSQPWMTQFRLLMRFAVPDFGDVYYLCSASSASSFHLLTAGHCVFNKDPLGDRTGRGGGFAAEIWAWAAETDLVPPLGDDPDFPWGVAKVTLERTYTAWQTNSDTNLDFAFLTLDRRVGDHVGWLGREWGVNATTLFYDGYPAEAPYVLPSNPFQYPGADIGNVVAYSCCRIQMDAFVYGGHSGGGVFRQDGANWMLQGVNSTSNRIGGAEATRITAQVNADLNNGINADRAARPPLDKAQLIEYVFNTTSKGLLTSSAAVGDQLILKLNAYNAGYAPSGQVTADIYLTQTLVAGTGTFIGSIFDLGELPANSFLVTTRGVKIPTDVQPGNYFVGWVTRGTAPSYDAPDFDAAIITEPIRVVGMASVTANPTAVVGGSLSAGTVRLTSPAPAGGADLLLSSSDPAAQFTGLLHINEGATSSNFNIMTSRVTKNTSVTITANFHGVVKTTTLLIKPSSQPAALKALALAPAVIVGGNSSIATVTLTGPAPAGGAAINLSSSSTKAVVPKNVRINAGLSTATFVVKTSRTTIPATSSIKATYAGVSKSATLTIKSLQQAAALASSKATSSGASNRPI